MDTLKPFQHAKCHAKRWGGEWNDYVEIDDFIDQTKAHFPDMRHRAILHNSFGAFLCEEWFGHTIINSAGREVSVRDVAEAHIIEDLGYIPTLQDYLIGMPMYNWLGGKHSESRKIEISESSMTIEQLKDKMKEFSDIVKQEKQDAIDTMVVDGASRSYYKFKRNMVD